MLTIPAFFFSTYFMFFKKHLKTSRIYTTENFIKTDEELTNGLVLLNEAIRPDIAESVKHLIGSFLHYYTDLLYEFNANKFSNIVFMRKQILNILSDLEFEIDFKDYEKLIQIFDKITYKYIAIINTKYDLPKNAPLPSSAFQSRELF